MNNQWRTNANLMVVWADRTYDSKRSCDECGQVNCKTPIHTDRYKEIGHSSIEESEGGHTQDYWSWMAINKPLGSKQDFDGEWLHTEYLTSNPDGLVSPEIRGSGISEGQFELAQEAFEQLTDKQKQVWQLVMREQLSQTAVAARLGITQQMVEKHLRYAKTKFIECLREKDGLC